MTQLLSMMKLSISFCSLCLFLLVLPIAAKAQQDEVLEKRIRSLVAQMTIEEKIGQTAMRGTSSRVKGTLPEALKNAVREGKVGAMLNVMNKDYVDELQRIAVEESPHGIPLIFGRDIIHGFKTIFPIPLGIAASWDTEVAKTAARISAVEGASGGIRWTFAPMLDICRDSRWGRIAESPGEDPFLGALMGLGGRLSGRRPDRPDKHGRLCQTFSGVWSSHGRQGLQYRNHS